MSCLGSVLLACTLALLSSTFEADAQSQLPETRGGDFSYDRNAALVSRTVHRVNAQLPPAYHALDRAAAFEVRTLIIMAITGASDAEILAYNEGTPLRLVAAASPFVDRAHLAVDTAFAILHHRNGAVPAPFGETLGVAILLFDSNASVRLRQRWAEINSLVAWLTR